MKTLEKLKNIKKGDTVIYYTGPTPSNVIPGSELDKIMREARRQEGLEKAVLVQRKISTHDATPFMPSEFEYIALGLEW